jgi:hypothetical protein
MTISHDTFLTIDEILADVLEAVNDKPMRLFSKGFYLRQIKMGLEKLNFQAPFISMFYDMDMPERLVIDIPSGAWDINDMFAFHPLKDDNCNPCTVGASAKIYHKANFLTTGKGEGYTAHTKPHQRDPFNPHFYIHDERILFYNVQNGLIMLSEACGAYPKLRIVARGTPKDVDKVKIIPPFAREALIGWGVERAFFSLKAQDQKYRVMWVDAKQDLFVQQSKTKYSKWEEAEILIRKMDKKVMNDLSQYLSQLYC